MSAANISVISKLLKTIKNNNSDNVTNIHINDDINFYNITISETYYKNEKGEGKFCRRRIIPSTKKKKYPTKIKTEIETEKKNIRFDTYNCINNYGN